MWIMAGGTFDGRTISGVIKPDIVLIQLGVAIIKKLGGSLDSARRVPVSTATRCSRISDTNGMVVSQISTNDKHGKIGGDTKPEACRAAIGGMAGHALHQSTMLSGLVIGRIPGFDWIPSGWVGGGRVLSGTGHIDNGVCCLLAIMAG